MNSDIRQANQALEQLRTSWVEAAITDTTPLVDGLWIDADPEQSDMAVSYDSRNPGLMTLKVDATEPGRWLTLNLRLGLADLAGLRMIGIAAKAGAQTPQTIRACIRSFRAGGFQDVFFPTYIYASDDETDYCDVLWIAEHPELIAPAAWRTLLLFFEPGTFSVDISELNVFVA